MEKLNRLNDVFIKSLLGSNERKNLTLDFINSILMRTDKEKFKYLEFQNTEIVSDKIHGKKAIPDILAITEKGNIVHIEVQVLRDRSIISRTLYYWSRIYGRQLDSSQGYDKFHPLISIILLDFDIFNYKDFHNQYHITNDKSHDILTNQMELHFIELKKVHISDIKKIKKSEGWIAYLSPNTNDNERKVIAMSNTAIKEALDYEPQFITNDRLRTAYTAEEVRIRDEATRRNETAAAIKESRKKGVDMINRLNEILIDNNRFDDLKKATKDKEYQKKLLIEYHLDIE